MFALTMYINIEERINVYSYNQGLLRRIFLIIIDKGQVCYLFLLHKIIIEAKEETNMSKTTIQLENLSCPSCIQKIDAAVANLYGVHTSKVMFNSSKVKATYDESLITADDIADRIESLGYPVLKVKR